jgi:hypothetical protein
MVSILEDRNHQDQEEVLELSAAAKRFTDEVNAHALHHVLGLDSRPT